MEVWLEIDFWLILRALSLIALIGFILVGLAFLITPHLFTGENIAGGSALWHSLSIAFMSTVTIIALLVALNPRIYWPMLLPLAIGKLTSSIISLYWYSMLASMTHTMLLLNSIVDGSIGVIALLLYIIARRFE
ncbi:MAG: hypothetical protein QXR02_05695 [Acidilobaceae archaeon]